MNKINMFCCECVAPLIPVEKRKAAAASVLHSAEKHFTVGTRIVLARDKTPVGAIDIYPVYSNPRQPTTIIGQSYRFSRAVKFPPGYLERFVDAR